LLQHPADAATLQQLQRAVNQPRLLPPAASAGYLHTLQKLLLLLQCQCECRPLVTQHACPAAAAGGVAGLALAVLVTVTVLLVTCSWLLMRCLWLAQETPHAQPACSSHTAAAAAADVLAAAAAVASQLQALLQRSWHTPHQTFQLA
jgi:hypothetical protein